MKPVNKQLIASDEVKTKSKSGKKRVIGSTEKKPKIQRVLKGQWYWAIGMKESTRAQETDTMEIYKIMECGDSIDNEHFNSGNYYPTWLLANEKVQERRREEANRRAREHYHQMKNQPQPDTP